MAAGLTIRREALERFRLLFDAEVRRHLSRNDLIGTLVTDGELSSDDLNLSLAEAISCAGPWGHEFPEPLFDGVFTVAECRVVGQKHLQLALRIGRSDRTCDAMAFFTNAGDWVGEADAIRLVYRLNVNEYRGRRKLQLIAEHMEPV